MNWNMIQGLFDGQGVVFWAAVSAVTLGLTMLSVSIVFQVRKMVGSGRMHIKRPALKRRKTEPETQARQRITVNEDVYQADAYVPAAAPAEAAPTAADPLLSNLLNRLKTSADRLEKIHASLGDNVGPLRANPDSALKETTEGVDYVFRTGRA